MATFDCKAPSSGTDPEEDSVEAVGFSHVYVTASFETSYFKRNYSYFCCKHIQNLLQANYVIQ